MKFPYMPQGGGRWNFRGEPRTFYSQKVSQLTAKIVPRRLWLVDAGQLSLFISKGLV